jgi:hypothetical protein
VGLEIAFHYLMLYVAIEDIPVIRLLLQMNPIENFSLGPFEFDLKKWLMPIHASTRYFTNQMVFRFCGGVNNLNCCGPFENVDIVNF